MKKILLVFGTRPEAIKMAPLVKILENDPDLNFKVCVTSQHKEMLSQVLSLFDIEPDFDLNIMQPNQDLYSITSNILLGMKNILEIYNPNLILVHGDTTTTFAASLAGFYKRITVGHVEAGLRTNDIFSPYPEEVNRQICSIIAKYHFASTDVAKQNLLNENKPAQNILVTGNTVIDSLLYILNKIKNTKNLESEILRELFSYYDFDGNKKIILVTGHRRENFGQGFLNVCDALKEIALRNNDVDIVFSVHLNPNVQIPVNKILMNIKNVYLIKPLRYETFVYLMHKSYFIITDSGGIQEEAPSLGKPVLVTRDITERPEAVVSGTVRLVGTNKDVIIKEAESLLNDVDFYTSMSKISHPFGDGSACKRILEFIKRTNFNE
ncbi:non-hydrolyzing UDP-N-acetylglucosamine 2-epimerase [Campylobacter sp. MOP51]|uniref:non-hydrolyzing UDP-N-acetylglucosamine 2-epimerase n=1 Tax=Campylobacter canis TaxID=3378588 RepID=UPI003C45B553